MPDNASSIPPASSTPPATESSAATSAGPGLDPAALANCLAVLAEAGRLDPAHPDSVAVQRAVGALFKEVKRQRRLSARSRRQEADRRVIESTATGSAERIDDETAGIPLTSNAAGAIAGVLERARDCYICKLPYTQVDAFYHQLCPACAADHHRRRSPSVNLHGRRALLTGGRAKIGMYIALMLLRDGAELTITTRFPRDAARRFAAMQDSPEWLHRLTIVGIDLRDPAQVIDLADSIAAQGSLDILINNAAQTVRRSPGAYSSIVAAEGLALEGAAADIPRLGLDHAVAMHPRGVLESTGVGGAAAAAIVAAAASADLGNRLVEAALVGGSASAARVEDGTAIDAAGLHPDVVDANSWVNTAAHVDPRELLEVQLCNSVAPFILVSRLRGALAASPHRRTYVVNVSAMEGQFSRRYKGPGHPHTNMAKAALNMLTRTSAGEFFADGILMTAVDTGWITDERPHTTKMRLAEEGFRAPLDLVDGAARVYDPIVQGENGIDLYGCFLKDYRPSPW